MEHRSIPTKYKVARITTISLCIVALVGCASVQIGTAMKRYDDAVAQVNLGDSKQTVLSIMEPSQKSLTRKQRKAPERYLKDGVKVEIHYFRSGWQPDNLTTDDEFTPFVFNDDKLVAIGWQALGGPKSVGQATDTINVQQSTTTIVR